ncbi:MAG: hypothetical protein ACRDG9_10705 [Actinomycetota bacterium]
MRKAIVSLSVLLAMSGVLVAPPAANATTPLGPICFSTLPFDDVFVWFLDPHGTTANSTFIDAVGKDISILGDRSQSVSVLVDRATSTLRVGFTTYPAENLQVPVIGGGTIDLTTGSGPGECFAPDSASCGPFTFQVIACPAASAPVSESTGRIQGKRE